MTDKKIIGGIAEPELTTVDGQKIIRGITKADLMTVNGQKNYRGAKSLVGGKKVAIKKKVATKNVGYQSPSEERQRPAGGAKKLPAEGRPSPKLPNVMPLTSMLELFEGEANFLNATKRYRYMIPIAPGKTVMYDMI